MCGFVKAAKQKCIDLGVSEDEFRLHLDFTDMEKFDSGEDSDGTDQLVNQAMLKDLVRINKDQQCRIDKLVGLFDKISITPSATVLSSTKVGGGVPFTVAGGVDPTSHVGLPAKHTAPAASHTGLPGAPSVFTPAVTTHASTTTAPTGVSASPGLSTSITTGVSSVSAPPTHGHTFVHHSHPSTTHVVGGGYSTAGHYTPFGVGVPMSSGNSSNPLVGSPASVLQSPLTPALGQLFADTDVSTRGIQLRPEYHVQHIMNNVPVRSINYKTMSYYDLMLGMAKVAKFLYNSGGDIASYLGHVIFVARQAQLDAFVDFTFVQYDHILIDAVLDGEIPTFIAGYPLAQSMCFHSANHKMGQRNKGRWAGAKKPKGGLASEICYNFNFKTCEGCQRIHACKNCKGNHKAPSCPNKDKNSQ